MAKKCSTYSSIAVENGIGGVQRDSTAVCDEIKCVVECDVVECVKDFFFMFSSCVNLPGICGERFLIFLLFHEAISLVFLIFS